jgi:hypothetical protein
MKPTKSEVKMKGTNRIGKVFVLKMIITLLFAFNNVGTASAHFVGLGICIMKGGETTKVTN